MHTRAPRGTRTVTFFRLCSRAPWTTSSSAAITDPVYCPVSDGNVCSHETPASEPPRTEPTQVRAAERPPPCASPLLAGVDVLDAVALVLERRAVRAPDVRPAVVLALVLRESHRVRLEVVRRAVEVDEVGLDVVARVVRADADPEAHDVGVRAHRLDLAEAVERRPAGAGSHRAAPAVVVRPRRPHQAAPGGQDRKSTRLNSSHQK